MASGTPWKTTGPSTALRCWRPRPVPPYYATLYFRPTFPAERSQRAARSGYRRFSSEACRRQHSQIREHVSTRDSARRPGPPAHAAGRDPTGLTAPRSAPIFVTFYSALFPQREGASCSTRPSILLPGEVWRKTSRMGRDGEDNDGAGHLPRSPQRLGGMRPARANEVRDRGRCLAYASMPVGTRSRARPPRAVWAGRGPVVCRRIQPGNVAQT